MLPEDFALETGDVSVEDFKKGEFVDKAGRYHFEVQNVKEDLSSVNDSGKAQSPHFSLTCVVIGTEEGQSPTGCIHMHRLYVGAKEGEEYKEGTRKMLLKFLASIGVIEEVEVVSLTGENKKVLVDTETKTQQLGVSTFRRMQGRQFVAALKSKPMEPRKDSNGNPIPLREGQTPMINFEIPYNTIYLPDDPHVAGWKCVKKDLYETAKSMGFTAGSFVDKSTKTAPPDDGGFGTADVYKRQVVRSELLSVGGANGDTAPPTVPV